MKYALLKIILFLSIFLILFNFNNQRTLPVFLEEIEDEEYKFITIYTDGLTTKNFYNYFDSMDFIKIIYPKINQIYKYKLENYYYNCNEKCNINSLVEKYKNKLASINIIEPFLDYYGINISKIIIYSNNDNLRNILKKCTICRIGG